MNSVKNKENYQKALEIYYESAEKGHALSELQLGRMFLLGEGVEQDYKAALEWIQRSAEQDNGEAQAYLGQMYEKGLGVDKEVQKALELYKKSAGQSNALGQARLAGLYLAGLGVEQNLRVAFVWNEKSAEQGNGEAQSNLGHMYEKGLGVNRDIRRAAELYKKSADQDNAFGQLRLGDFYLNGLAVEKNPRKAFSWYNKAAAQDKDPQCAAQAQLRLGAMYCQGNGVEKDLKKGFAFYERSAQLGNEEAQLSVGAMYKDGVGVERNQKKALEWFQKSARKSKAPSKRAMGDIYRDGLVVEKNIPEAIKWYKKAAEEGDPRAKTELLKLQSEASAQPGPGTEAAPADKGDARATTGAATTPPAGAVVEKNREKAQAVLDQTAENAEVPARVKLQVEKKIPAKTSPRSVPRQAGQAKKTHTPVNSPYIFAAIAVIVVSLAAVFIGFSKKAKPTWKSLEIRAAEITALPRPDPRSIPRQALEPASKFLKKINAAKAPIKKNPAPIVEASRAAVRTAPVAPLLRREYKSLDEGEISRMLAAKNLFDAERNSGGNFQHQYEIRNSAGLRLILTASRIWFGRGSRTRSG